MNHGGRAAVDDFGRTVSKVAVAQICESAGFHSVRESALEALADISLRYLSDLGKMAEFYANLAGRSQCNVFDVIRSLEDLETSQGFPGASEASQCLSSSGTIKQIVNFVGSIEEIPFAHPIPQFPVIKDRKTIPSFIQMDETPPNKHIPAWLPAFPDPHTYISTSMWNERTADPLADKINQARQRRKAERSLLSLQQRLICNGTAAGETSTSRCAAAQDQGRVEENSFLQTPIPSGEKDVSSIVLPSKLSDETVGANRVSVLEAFAPAIEIAKNSGLCEDGEEEKMVLPVVRPTVHFKFRTGKKLIGESLDMRQQKKDIVGTASLTVREDESQRDEKKRRAEYILKQSMENPQELTML
ncbi:transcription initiation factor TFIID subunit 8-like [Senna tora]|uniref:Transcription initiation factor TFIID subunit 8 n=1 Tax=Senna tora TaxID=362788 RepID=A0A834WIT7_9FABA|nr:transcription initiation factor TFIID subunit 8-like [Senna tora]